MLGNIISQVFFKGLSSNSIYKVDGLFEDFSQVADTNPQDTNYTRCNSRKRTIANVCKRQI